MESVPRIVPLPPPLPPHKLVTNDETNENDANLRGTQEAMLRDFQDELGKLTSRISGIGLQEGQVGSFSEDEGGFKDNHKEKMFPVVLVSGFLEPILQKGPQCGIVALAMVKRLFMESQSIITCSETSKTLIVESILEIAKLNGFTKNGEMFSAKNMATLSNIVLEGVAEANVIELTESPDFLIDHFCGGRILIVPYDADYNHGPTTRNGKSAHWATIQGILLLAPKTELDGIHKIVNSESQSLFSNPSKVGIILTSENCPDSTAIRDLLSSQKLKSENVFVLTRHGKSTHLALWSYKELYSSNQNLRQISDKILKAKDDFVLEDIEVTLRGQGILLGIHREPSNKEVI